MSEELKNSRGEINETGTTIPAGQHEESAGDRNSESTTKKRGRKRKTETISGNGETTATASEKEKFSGLAVLNDETQTEIPTVEEKPKKKKRQRIKKNENQVFNKEQIKALLITISTISKNNPGTACFALTEQEAEQIAEPLGNILSKKVDLNSLGEHSDSIALLTSCFLIFTPKIMAYISYMKIQKAMKPKNIKIAKGVTAENEQTRENKRSNNGTNGTVTSNNENNVEPLMSALPPIM